MEADYCLHEVSSKLKLTLFQTFTSIHSNHEYQVDVSHPNYMIRSRKQQSDIFIVNEEFTEKVLQNMKLDNNLCFSFLKKQEECYSVACCKNSAELTKLKFENGQQQKYKLSAAIATTDQFIFLSNFIELHTRNIQVAIAYTKKNQFYLLVIKNNCILESIRLTNQSDINTKKGWLSWFQKQYVKIYNHINLYLFKIDKYQKFLKLIAVREGHVTCHIISLQFMEHKLEINLIDQAHDLLQIVSPEWKVKSSIFRHHVSLEFRSMDIFIAFETGDNTIRVYKIHLNSLNKNIFSSSFLLDKIPSCHFEMIFFNDNLYYLFYNQQTNKFQVIRNKVCWIEDKQNLKLLDQNPFLVFDHKPYFRKQVETLFIIEQNQIYSMKQDEEESDFSYQQRKWIAFKDGVNNIYSKMIKQVNPNRIVDLVLILQRKQQKLHSWLKRQKCLLTQQDYHVVEILGIQIICITILRTITHQFYKIQNISEEKHMSITEKDVFEVAMNGQISEVISLLSKMVQNNEIKLFLSILYQLKHLRIQSYFIQCAKTLLEEPYKLCAQKFIQKQISENQFQLVLQQIARLNIVQLSHLEHFINKGKYRFVRELVVMNKMKSIFIELLVDNNKVKFYDDSLRLLLLLLKNESLDAMKQFVKTLLKRCKNEQSKNTQFLSSILHILVQSFIPYHHDIFYDIDRLLPGLNFFILAKTGDRKKVLQLLVTNPYFQQLKNKNLLKLFVEDLFKKSEGLDHHISVLYDTIFYNNEAVSGRKMFNQIRKQRRTESDSVQFVPLAQFEKYPSKKIKE